MQSNRQHAQQEAAGTANGSMHSRRPVGSSGPGAHVHVGHGLNGGVVVIVEGHGQLARGGGLAKQDVSDASCTLHFVKIIVIIIITTTITLSSS